MSEKIYMDQIMAGEITVDHRHQREIIPAHVTYLRNNWDPAAIGVIYLSKRGDNLYHCIDGQNRVAAGQEIDPTIIFNALVIEGLTDERESELFIKFNEMRRGVQPYDRWQQHLGFQDPTYVELTQMLHKHGLDVGRAASANRVAALTKITGLYKRYGLDSLDLALQVLSASWSRTSDSWLGTLIGSVTKLIYMNPRISLDHLIDILSKNEPQQWDKMRAGGSTGSDADNHIAREIAERYNKTKRGRNRLILDLSEEEELS